MLNVVENGPRTRSAIIVDPGKGKEDRLLRGSYIALRETEERKRHEERLSLLDNEAANNSYPPDFLD